MAMLDVGARSGRRDLSRDLPLVPFIDFLLCIIAFLLVTAVWSQMARLESSALASGLESVPHSELEPTLHVDMRSEGRFIIEWRRGATVLTKDEFERRPLREEEGTLRYPALAAGVLRIWAEHGIHRSASDPARDKAVLHASNQAEFEEIVAAMDAVHGVTKSGAGEGRRGDGRAFDVTFAAD